jgi:hypothetical protein
MLGMAEPGLAHLPMECTGTISMLQEQEQQRNTETRLVALEQMLNAGIELSTCTVFGETMVLTTSGYESFRAWGLGTMSSPPDRSASHRESSDLSACDGGTPNK